MSLIDQTYSNAFPRNDIYNMWHVWLLTLALSSCRFFIRFIAIDTVGMFRIVADFVHILFNKNICDTYGSCRFFFHRPTFNAINTLVMLIVVLHFSYIYRLWAALGT